MAINKRTSKEIKNKDDIDFLINLKEDDITTSLIMELFGDYNVKQRFNPYDIITIPIGSYGININGKEKKNKNAFTTTIGRFIFNKYFIESEPELFNIIGYINETNYGKFLEIKEQINYSIMTILQNQGVELAYNTQTIYVKK